MCAAVVGVAGLAGSSNVAADNLSVTVEPRVCKFQNTATAVAGDVDFTGSGTIGKEVSLNNAATHYFNVFCSYKYGYNVKGEATDLMDPNITSSKIAFTNSYGTSGTDSLWTAVVSDGDDDAVLGKTGDAKVVLSRDEISDSEGEDFSVNYKVYIGTGAQPGTYTGSATYTLTANPTPPFVNGMAMQDEDAAARCADMNMNDYAWVKDTRTGKTYPIQKVWDGNCWMEQSLWLPGWTAEQPTITTARGNEFTLPVSDDQHFDEPYGAEARMYSGTHIDGSWDYSPENTGSFFNWVAATAGGAVDAQGEAIDSLCPRGWVLPSYTQYDFLRSEYNRRYDELKNNWSNFSDNFWAVEGVSGIYEGGSYDENSSAAWSRTKDDDMSAYSFYNEEADSSSSLSSGFAIRCVLVSEER